MRKKYVEKAVSSSFVSRKCSSNFREESKIEIALETMAMMMIMIMNGKGVPPFPINRQSIAEKLTEMGQPPPHIESCRDHSSIKRICGGVCLILQGN